MKSVLISIRPKWCELIASGKKTVEVRRTRPNIEVPFKCYIYETQGRYEDMRDCKTFKYWDSRQKVIGEFVCDCIEEFVPTEKGICFKHFSALNATCLTLSEIRNYADGKKVYGWHISELKIYDKPKELGEFKKAGFLTEEQWLFALYPNTHCHYEAWAKKFEITKPFQSWGYVEEVKK